MFELVKVSLVEVETGLAQETFNNGENHTCFSFSDKYFKSEIYMFQITYRTEL